MQPSFVLLSALFLVAFHADEKVLEEKTVLDGKVKFLLPKSFGPMSEKWIKIKYPGSRRPTLVFSDESGSVSLGLNHTNNKIPKDQLNFVHKEMEKGLKKVIQTKEYWHRSEVTTINGQEFMIFEYQSKAIDTIIRNITVGAVLEDRLLIITFNVTKELEKDWLEVGRKIIDSIKIK